MNKGNLLKHLSIPIMLIVILTIMLIPIPTAFLDISLALNITLSLIILFAALYIDKAIQFSAFPAILLVTTLFRLGMNIASTRLILLNGDQGMDAAGNIIQAFGEFVVGGSYVVGIVVFVAISVINLKVITKGSSRIAEVAARFTLDAMPGKQMAIDSDLNTGLINEQEAKERRKDIARESEFYGSMDGAAKFVSGDAVAGLFLAALNIVGGLFVGMVQKGMDWRSAAETYTLLTIGDGLVAQIPSIIVSTSAGLIVARAASSGEDLSSEILGQLSRSVQPLMLTSAVCFGFAIIPGLPFMPFMTLSLITGIASYFRRRAIKEASVKVQKEAHAASTQASDKPRPGSTEEVVGLLGIDTLELEVGYEMVSLVENGDLVERIRSLRRQFALDYGFIVPAIHIRDNIRIKPSEYRLLLKGAVIGSGELKMGHLLAMSPGNITTPVQGIPTKEPAFGLDALWIEEEDKEKAQIAGYTVVDLSTVVTTQVTELIRTNMHEILGRQETQSLIDNLTKTAPRLVEEVIPNLLTIGQVQQVLAHLLREQVSIRDLKTIMETLADWAPSTKSTEKLVEYVRRRLARTITEKYSTPEGVLPLVSLNPNLERTLSGSIQQTEDGTFVALEPSTAQILITKLNNIAEKFVELGQTPIVLVPAHIRAAVSRFVDRFVPGVAVISHQEIAPHTKVKSLGVVGLD